MVLVSAKLTPGAQCLDFIHIKALHSPTLEISSFIITFKCAFSTHQKSYSFTSKHFNVQKYIYMEEYISKCFCKCNANICIMMFN